MIRPGLQRNSVPGMIMTKSLFRISLAAAALASVSLTALAADLPPPDIRPATYDWTGPYVGGVAALTFLETSYVPLCVPGPCDPDLSGDGFAGGAIAGYNMQWDDFVVGIEGDWMWGGETAQNILDAVELSFDNIVTLRARVGVAMDDTLIYITGGYAGVDTTMDALVGATPYSLSDSVWHHGWTIGGGIEHAIWDNLHLRLEYLYASLGKETYDLQTGDPLDPGGLVRMDLENLHMVRGAITWNFVL
jgi:outer membrane immunogenic protein